MTANSRNKIFLGVTLISIINQAISIFILMKENSALVYADWDSYLLILALVLVYVYVNAQIFNRLSKFDKRTPILLIANTAVFLTLNSIRNLYSDFAIEISLFLLFGLLSSHFISDIMATNEKSHQQS